MNLSFGHEEAPERADHRTQMIAYIRTHFSDILGADADLLDAPGGLDTLAAKIQQRLARGRK